MKINIFKRLLPLVFGVIALSSCDLALQKDYDYEPSTLDPHVDMTAWEFIGTRTDLFSAYIDALEYTGLKSYYTQTDKKYTFLALTNTAMQSYMSNKFPGKSSIRDCDLETVRKMILYHIVDGEYSSYNQLEVTASFVLTELRGEEGLMTMLVRKNPWQADAGKIVVNDTNTNAKSPMRSAVSSNIMPTNGVLHVFDAYCYYQK